MNRLGLKIRLDQDLIDLTDQMKELDLVDRLPEELWTEVHDTVQEAVTEIVPKKKKCKKAKWLSEESVHIAEKRREVKGKGERERLNPTECRVPENGKER